MMIGNRNKSLLLIVVALIAMSAISPLPANGQQPATTRYVYDDNGRLRAVVFPTGEATIYDYDAAGNFTGIRKNSATALELISFAPHEGVPGDAVTFIGTGFGAGITGVSFNGAAGTVLQASPTVVIAQVPQGATTGPVTINTPVGSVTTPVPFVIAGVRVSPPSVLLFFGDSFQFNATVTVSGDQSLTWSVNGITGGNSSVGTITQAGFYTAPSATVSVTVRATSNASPAQFGEALVNVRDSASVQVPLSSAVSVRHGSITGEPATTAMPLSVRYGSPPGYGAASPSSVSVTTGPAITGIAPGNVPRNASTSITITGSNLTGANVLKFIKTNGTVDTAITVSNISVNAEGTQLTATLAVTSSATTGERVVVVMTATLKTLLLSTGSNTIQIQ